MKKLTSIILLLFASGIHSLAQTSTSDCEGAIVLCDDFYSEKTAPPGTGNIYEYTGVCNQNNETMSLWYTFTVQQDGNLSFVLTPNTLSDDYDWGLFDITTGGCAGISANGVSPEVSCNSYGTLTGDNGATGISSADGGTGNSNGPGDTGGPPFNADLPVTVGQTFALVVMNWTNSQDGYNIDFGGSTATIYDNINPTLVAVNANCGNMIFDAYFSENIVQTSIQDIDFQISGPGGTFNFINVTTSNPGADSDDHLILELASSIVVPGIYTVHVTNTAGSVADPCGNIALDASFNIDLSAPVTFETTILTACNGTGGSLEIDNIVGGASPYSLSLNNIAINGNLASNLDAGNYVLRIADQNNCVITQPVQIPDNLISVTIPGQDTLSCARPTVDISGVLVSPEQNVTYQWSYVQDGNAGATGQTSSTPTFGASGLYILTVTNTENGCSNTAQIFLATEEVESFDLNRMRFPNIITSNKDSNNEDWAPFIDGDPNFNLASLFEKYDLKIFNRWGNLLFESSKGGGRRWSANDVDPGTYYYTFEYRITCGGIQEGKKHGWIEVLK